MSVMPIYTLPNTTVVIWVTITSVLDRTGQSPVQTVPACPIQIRAHHHMSIQTSISWLLQKVTLTLTNDLGTQT